jgi:hypothetical protein
MFGLEAKARPRRVQKREVGERLGDWKGDWKGRQGRGLEFLWRVLKTTRV